jgi:hypothetical protein
MAACQTCVLELTGDLDAVYIQLFSAGICMFLRYYTSTFNFLNFKVAHLLFQYTVSVTRNRNWDAGLEIRRLRFTERLLISRRVAFVTLVGTNLFDRLRVLNWQRIIYV